jgi:predicted lipoprotein with Yx(FWY)xxD motif
LWPPLFVTGRPLAGAGVNPKLLETVRRKQPAGIQVTYNHHPLYLYRNDKKPGDLKGQGYYNYWYVLSPSAKPIEKPAP